MEILLHENPDDLGALVTMADINNRLKNYAAAVKLFERVVAIAEEKQDLLLRVYVVALGEAQVMANNGEVGDDAIKTFEYALTIKGFGQSPIARYYLAMAKAQRGEPEKALIEWQMLLGEGSPGIFWKARLRQAITETKKALREKAQ